MSRKSKRRARVPRFYLDAEILTGQAFTLSKPASHHLVKVLRMRSDTPIELFNGDGYNYRATLVDTGQQSPGKCASLDVHERYQPNTQSPLHIELVQAISTGERMDTTIRQSVELGVNAIQPIYSRHSVKTFDEKRLAKRMEHWRNIVISACEQSGRSQLAEVAEPIELSQWLAHVSTDREQGINAPQFMLTPTAAMSLYQQVASLSSRPDKLSLLIGPESGFDSDETDLALAHGIQAVSFGPRILRTETAGPACIASLQSLLGDQG